MEEIGSLSFGASILLVPVFQQIGSTFPIKPAASCGEEDVDSSVKGFPFKGLNMLEMILPSAFGKWCCLTWKTVVSLRWEQCARF